MPAFSLATRQHVLTMLDAVPQEFTSPDSLDSDLLPQSLQEVAAVAGPRAALALIVVYAPKDQLYVGVKPSPVLQQLLGHEQAERLRADYGGDIIPLPQISTVTRILRNQRICNLRRQGWTLMALASHFGLSKRMIAMILADNGVTGRATSRAALPHAIIEE